MNKRYKLIVEPGRRVRKIISDSYPQQPAKSERNRHFADVSICRNPVFAAQCLHHSLCTCTGNVQQAMPGEPQ